MPCYHGALDQHLAILNSACRYEGGGHRFELDKVLMHTSFSDRALIDRVTFKYWGFMLFFLDLPSEHYCDMQILTLSRIDIYCSFRLVWSQIDSSMCLIIIRHCGIPPFIKITIFYVDLWLLNPFVVTCELLYWGIPSKGY